MHNTLRMERQIELYEALIDIAAKRGTPITFDVAASLVVAARLEEFNDTFAENIHRAGEGI